jgi:hypothetical protein
VNALRLIRNACLHLIWMTLPEQAAATLLSIEHREEMSLSDLRGSVDVAEETGDFVATVSEERSNGSH